MTAALFLASCAFYIAALPPSLAPWRDTGEMTAAAFTLGVAHPPSYPLYILAGKAWLLLAPGNPAYRLGLLSAVCAAGAVALLFFSLRRRLGAGAAAAGALLLALDPRLRDVAGVSEMYAPWVLGAVLALDLAGRAAEPGGGRLWPGFCFACGLLLGNRLDLVLWAPGLAWLALSGRPGAATDSGVWAAAAFAAAPLAVSLGGSNLPVAALSAGTLLWRARGEGASRRLLAAAAWGAAGLSVYAFLPVRSASGPWLDWNHPASPGNLVDSLLRTRYGGTLDLVSKSYARGELFGDNLRLWGRHLWAAFGPHGLLAALAGAAAAWRARRARSLGLLAAWWWSGPVFLFLANMPPNPHAAAIVAPHYLLTDILACAWAAEGAAALGARAGAYARAPAALLAAAALLWPLRDGGRAALFDRRGQFDLHDYAAAAFASAPPGAIVVARKDVQLFSLWHRQAVEGRRPDLRLVAQGLAGSPWYKDSWRRRDPSLPLGPLREDAGWEALSAGGPVYATQDAEGGGRLLAEARPRGVLLAVSPRAEGDDAGALDDILVRRGAPRAELARDFFTADLAESWAWSAYRRGTRRHALGRPEEAARELLKAWSLQWSLPEAATFLGYLEASAGRPAAAAPYYAAADALYAGKLRMAAEYRSLPELVAAVSRQAAEAVTHRGVAAEKLGSREEAEAHYRRALALYPLAQTRFNLAVLAWGRDWPAVEEHLAEALRLDPGHAEARRHLESLRRARAAGSR